MSKNDAIKALVKAQSEMGKALKDSTNPHFRSSYASLSSVLSAILPALNSNGFALMQPDGYDDHGQYVETVFIHESGDQFSNKVYLTSYKDTMQGYGGAQSYARRYGALGLAGLAPEDDDGNEASDHPKKNQQRTPPPKPAGKSKEQRTRERLLILLSEAGVKDRDLRLQFAASVLDTPVETYSDLSVKQMTSVATMLKNVTNAMGTQHAAACIYNIIDNGELVTTATVNEQAKILRG